MREELLAALLDSVPEGVWFADCEGIVRYWNKRAEAITGFSANEVLGMAFGELFSYCGETGEPGIAPLRETLDDEMERHAHVFLRHKLGHRIAVEVQTMPVRSPEGELIGAREILYESVLRRGSVLEKHGLWETKIESPTREYMLSQLELRLEQFREDGIPTGALLIEIDHLGEQNRHLGREAKDHLLAMVSRTTLLCIRFTDISGRWGEDSILAIMQPAANGTLEAAGKRIRSLIAASELRWWGEIVKITVTAGCTMFQAGDSAALVVERLMAGATNGRH
jgi:PAS domain S-box-containing protein/diguanylate cyclase (GGDEF)-like protein